MRVIGKFKQGANQLWLFTVGNQKLIGALWHKWQCYKAAGQRVVTRVVEQVDRTITGNHATSNSPPESTPDIDSETLHGQALLLAKRQALGLSPPTASGFESFVA